MDSRWVTGPGSIFCVVSKLLCLNVNFMYFSVCNWFCKDFGDDGKGKRRGREARE